MKKTVQEYITYITPKFIFIPFDDINKLRIKRNKIVYNSMFLGNLNNGDNIYSPVSGNIIGIKDITTFTTSTKCLVIENDFIDKREKINSCKSRETLLKLKKTEINDILKKYNFNKTFLNKKSLIINSEYNKQNNLGDMVLNYEYYEEILETIDLLMELYKIKNSYIIIPKKDLYSEYAFSKYINAFDNICIINNNKKYKENEIITLSIEEVLAINKALHRDYFYDNTFITITTDLPVIIKVKLFTSLIEIFKDLKIPYKDKKIYINNKIYENIENFIITREVKNIVLK